MRTTVAPAMTQHSNTDQVHVYFFGAAAIYGLWL